MKRNITFVLLLVIAIATLGLAAASSSKSLMDKESNAVQEAPNDLNSQQVVTQPQLEDPPGIIDGAQNPEMIPDHIAYLMLFRLISNRPTAEDREGIRSYVRQMGLGKQDCTRCPTAGSTEDVDIEALLSAADDFYQRISIIDQQTTEIKDRTWPNPTPDTLTQLNQLQSQKETLVADVVSSLPSRLSAEAVNKIRSHINGHVKQRVKLFPEVTTPPSGPGWQHGMPEHTEHGQN